MIVEKFNKIRKINKEIKDEKDSMRILPKSLPMYSMAKTRIKHLKKEKMKIIRGKN